MNSHPQIVYMFLLLFGAGLEAKEEIPYQIKYESIAFENREGGEGKKYHGITVLPNKRS